MFDIMTGNIVGASEIYTPIPDFVDWFQAVFDASVADRYRDLLAASRATATPEQLDAALAVATRYAAVDTGAIEGLYTVDRGFTRTIATQAAAWEATLAQKGARTVDAINDALGAYEYVLDAATQAVQVSEVWIRELHSIICRTQSTYTVYTPLGPQERELPKGQYKSMPNSPTNTTTGVVHNYAPVLDTGPEMGRLVEQLRSEPFMSAHPILQAAYAHYAYVCIHPFADGNGRVARALASVYLYRSPGVPLLVFADQRTAYLDALEAADAGDPASFITFIEARVLDAVGIVRSQLQRSTQSVDASIARISAFFGEIGITEESLALAARLKKSIRDAAAVEVARLQLPRQLRLDAPGVFGIGSRTRPPTGYGAIGQQGELSFHAASDWPVRVAIYQGVQIFVKDDENAGPDLLCVPQEGDALEVWYREIEPTVSETLRLKLEPWVEFQVARLVAAVDSRISNPGA
ncbi:Fic family protein [Microbacterium sp. CIAB417]|uniref:Fic family protein n=1 Tax=Microbacterium sp. CIAB417 TaxID=2860287 RepID=UPI001FADCABB|nr:Fic family protein [Microbacterium sp. CIAB417]